MILVKFLLGALERSWVRFSGTPEYKNKYFNYQLDEVNHKHIKHIESGLPYQSLL